MTVKLESSGSERRQVGAPVLAVDVPIRLHVASGGRPEPGFVGMDKAGTDAELTHDPSVFPWPVEARSVAEAVCFDYVHRTTPVGGPDDGLVALMNELHRVLVPCATARIVHPHARTDRALRDPATTRLISDQTWWFFDQDWRASEHLDRPEVSANFEIVTLTAPLHLDWHQRSPIAQAFALEHYWNVIGDLEVVLRAREPGRQDDRPLEPCPDRRGGGR
jgi:hypothetical protein